MATPSTKSPRPTTPTKARTPAALARTGTREAQRNALLDVASRILAEEGEAALSVRRVATEYGASTMAVYSLFEGKEGLVDALLAEGFRRFAEALGCVNEADPFTHLRELGRAYRGFALENPTYYALLWKRQCFGPVALTPMREVARRHGEAAFRSLAHAVGRVLAATDKPARDVDPLAFATWSTVHGAVLLELAGIHGGDAATATATYERTLDFIQNGFRASR